MDYEYFPVFRKQNMFRYEEHDIRSLTSFFGGLDYDKILLNAYNYNSKTLKDLTNVGKADADIMGDSGGYQIMTGKAKESMQELRPKILEWLEQNCSKAMTLDVPPANIDFDTALKKSVDNNEYFSLYRKGGTRFITVLHGNDYEEISKWLDSNIKYAHDFDGGFAVGGIIGNPQKQYKTLMTLAILYQRGILDDLTEKQVLHILGETKLADLFLSMYFLHRAGNFKFKLTSDSQYNVIISAKNLFCPSYVRLCPETPPLIPFNVLVDKNYRCGCKVCSNDSVYNSMIEGKINKTDFLYAHNHVIMLERLSELFRLSKLPSEVLRYYFRNDYVFKLCAIDDICSDKDNAPKTVNKYKAWFIEAKQLDFGF